MDSCGSEEEKAWLTWRCGGAVAAPSLIGLGYDVVEVLEYADAVDRGL